MKFVTSCHETKYLVTLSRLVLFHMFFVKTKKKEKSPERVTKGHRIVLLSEHDQLLKHHCLLNSKC